MLRNGIVSGVVACALTSACWAEDKPEAKSTTANKGEHQVSDKWFDAHAADCLILGNQEEVAMSRWAMDKLKDARVKELAAMLIKDHEAAAAKLQKFGTSGRKVEFNRDRDAKTTNREPAKAGAVVRADAKDADPAKPGIQQTAGTHDHDGHHGKIFEMQHKMVQECLFLTQECLEKYEGSEFDQAFLGQQIGAHIGSLAKLNVLEKEVASADFQAVIRESQKTVKMHKDHIEKLMGELEGNRGDRAAKKETTTNK